MAQQRNWHFERAALARNRDNLLFFKGQANDIEVVFTVAIYVFAVSIARDTSSTSLCLALTELTGINLRHC